MRSASPELINAISSETTSLARLWRVTRADGALMYFTDAVKPITFSGNTYRSDVSFTASAIMTTRTAVSMQNVTITTNCDDTAFAEGDIRLGLYKGATAVISVVDYNHPEWGELVLFEGSFGQIVLSNQHMASIDIIPLAALAGAQTIGGEVYTKTCKNNLGDSLCTVNIEALRTTFIVTSASGGSVVASAFSQPGDTWVMGRVKWTTGKNAGTSSSVQASDPTSTTVFLSSNTFYPILPGDTGYIYPGCDKQVDTCINKFANFLNFRGEPDIPDGNYRSVAHGLQPLALPLGTPGSLPL